MILTTNQSRAADRFAIQQLGIPGIVLMENAGRGASEILLAESPLAVVVCCGMGNNGGDGFVIARHLANRRIPTKLAVIGSLNGIVGDARTNLEIVESVCVILNDTPGCRDCRELITLVEDRPGHDWRYAIDPSKIETELGWKAMHSFDDALRDTVKWYLDNPEWVESCINGQYRNYYEQNYRNR